MRTYSLKCRPQINRSGSALIWFLLFIALVILVYSVQWYLKKTTKDPDVCNDLTPWKEWRLRQSNPKPKQEPSSEQPNITEIIRYDASAKLQDKAGGKIRLEVYPDGTVEGEWYDQYYKSKINYDILGADFKGNTYPRKIYCDENGKDRSKLYFMAKGTFLIAETDFEKDKLRHMGGDIYVTGWISPDYSVIGEITITSDEKYFEIFDWKTYHPN